MPEARATIIVDAKDNASAVLAGIGKAGGKAGAETKAGMNDAIQGLTGFNVASLAGVGGILAVGAGLKYAIDQAAESQTVPGRSRVMPRAWKKAMCCV